MSRVLSGGWSVMCASLGLLAGLAMRAQAQTFEIGTPLGPVTIEVPHVAPQGTLVRANAPESPGFRPPTIFSAPLPSGSGARALGMAGAFTAVADDATAASWNPGGLLQLEEPEFSFVLRLSDQHQQHTSASDDFVVGEDDFSNFNLNYMSAVYPFQFASRNFVVSLNLQEAYDFTQRFHADLSRTSKPTHAGEKSSKVYHDTVTEHVDEPLGDGSVEMDVTSFLTTRKTSALSQVLDSDLLSELEFEQEGILYAITPALAAEITPKLSAGVALNFYRESPLSGQAIRSRTTAHYEGSSASRVRVTDTVNTTGRFEYDGVAHLPAGGEIPVPIDVPFDGSGTIEPFSDSAHSSDRDNLRVEGVYDEVNEFDDFEGINLTLGGLWTVSQHLSLGASVDLPWTADATQRKTVKNSSTTRDASGRVLDVSESEDVQVKDVEFEFPLFWTVGAVWRWTDLLYTSLDVGQTTWSDFSFKSEGDERLNPLDGSPYGEHPIDDCWTVRGGVEYLLLFSHTEVPLRAGVAWEERPAIGKPDEFYTFTLGSGLSIGQGDGKVIIDIAYAYSIGNDVLGSLVPGQDITTDVEEHQVFVSGIKHF